MIEREDVDGVAVLRLAHGPVSAMDIELCTAIAETFTALATDPATAVVITGTGRSFSAGVDLRRIVDGGPAYVEAFLPALNAGFRAVFTLGKPVVAAVNGHAIAGGCVLAACADVVLMADGPGRIGIPEIRVGVPFPRVPLQVMCDRVGDQVARKLVIGAETHPPDAAHAFGIVDEVVEQEALRDKAIAAAAALAAAVPADTFAVTKAQLRRGSIAIMDQGADEDARVVELWSKRSTDGWMAEYLARVTGKR